MTTTIILESVLTILGPFAVIYGGMMTTPRTRALAKHAFRAVRLAVKDGRISKRMQVLLTALAFWPIPGEADEVLCVVILWTRYRHVLKDAWRETA